MAGAGERPTFQRGGGIQIGSARGQSGDVPSSGTGTQRPQREPESAVLRELKVIAWTVGPAALVHPFSYAQVLMQVGYEPVSARLGRDIFGRPVLYLASVFEYFTHIQKHDGILGLFRGLGPSLGFAVASVYAARGAERLVAFCWNELFLLQPQVGTQRQRFGFLIPKDSGSGGSVIDNAFRFEAISVVGTSPGSYSPANFFEDLVKETAVASVGVAAAWPLNVIALRTMAQFVGGEKIYVNIFASVKEIYGSEGLSGFFKGLLPGVGNAVAVTVVSNVLVYLYAASNPEHTSGLNLVSLAAGSVVSAMFYPLKLTGRLLAISGAHLAAAKPPFIPKFKDSYSLYHHLVQSGQAKRGSSLFFRQVPSNCSPKLKFTAFLDSDGKASDSSMFS